MTNIKSLEKKIKGSGMTMVAISEKSGILRETLYNKLNGRGEFKVSEVTGLTSALNLTSKERDTIFFEENSELKSLEKED